MGFQVPAGIKEPFEKLPPGVIRFKIEGGTEGDVGTTEAPCFGIEMQMSAEDPPECAGIPHNARFYLGIRETDYLHKEKGLEVDPEATKEETLVATMGRFKAFCTAAGVEIEGKDTDLIYSELKDRKVLAKVEHKASKDNPDQTNARVTRWLPDGTIDPHVTAIPEQAATTNGAATKPGAKLAGPRPSVPTPAARPTASRLGARTVGATVK